MNAHLEVYSLAFGLGLSVAAPIGRRSMGRSGARSKSFADPMTNERSAAMHRAPKQRVPLIFLPPGNEKGYSTASFNPDEFAPMNLRSIPMSDPREECAVNAGAAA